MPRGPGKKENYNLDYSRFDCLDHDEPEVKLLPAAKANAATHQDASAVSNDSETDLPDLREMLRNMPPELQEAYRMMQLARESGDPAAQKRANELALQAVQNGSPEVQDAFVKQLSEHAPEAAKVLNSGQLKPKEAFEILRKAQEGNLPDEPPKPETPEDISSRIDQLKTKMERGADAAKKQMDNLAKQQEQLTKLQSPEDFFKFMQGEGMTEEDLQRMFSGDTAHMEKCVEGMLDKATDVDPEAKLGPDTSAALQAAEELHSTICRGEEPASLQKGQQPQDTDAPVAASKPQRAAREPPVEEVIIPDHRLQYQKDADGRYISVELKCSLPGVADMSVIALDVAEKHVRLTTSKPAPKYVVNAGPFPVLIEPSAARAKFSKKRGELTISIPAKAQN